MKKLATLLFLTLFTTELFADGSWTTTMGEAAPSCSLYRKRVANYYNRMEEFDLATRILKENLDPNEISRLVELYQRTGVPLLSEEKAVWTITVPINVWSDKIENMLSHVSVKSALITWETDKFLFPEGILKMVVDKNVETLKLEMIMALPFACLQDQELEIDFSATDGSKLELKYKLDRN